MRTTVAIAAHAILSVVTVAVADECHTICRDVKRAISYRSACSSFRSSLPRPKVARYCQDAFKAAVDANCYNTCIKGGHAQAFISERKLNEHCHHALNDAPRPLCHDACVKGYRSGVDDMSISLSKQMTGATLSSVALARGEAKFRQTLQAAHVTTSQMVTARHEEPLEDMDVQQRSKVGSSESLLMGQTIEKMVESQQHDREYEARVEKAAIPEETSRPITRERGIRDVDLAEKLRDGIAQEMEGKDELVLSLPINVDGVEKELNVFAGEEPVYAVSSFCNENMPDEGLTCVDQLLIMVQDELSLYAGPAIPVV